MPSPPFVTFSSPWCSDESNRPFSSTSVSSCATHSACAMDSLSARSVCSCATCSASSCATSLARNTRQSLSIIASRLRSMCARSEVLLLSKNDGRAVHDDDCNDDGARRTKAAAVARRRDRISDRVINISNDWNRSRRRNRIPKFSILHAGSLFFVIVHGVFCDKQ